ncbi:MAG TPA: dTDP-4-dehydrorhamnose reductase [Gemmatimonadaceae bacterium]|nr:dTDP-4-dehydrorhamnose reductase [Gemmatimonadaceae bacterium]
MRALITGAEGQLGRELVRCAPQSVELLAVDIAELDITDDTAVRATCSAFAPTIVINAAAYTAVDRAESEPERAFAVNEGGARNVARAAAEHDARMVHVSTDYVFDGTACRPYRPSDATRPVGVYGQSKLAGEEAVLSAAGERAVIVRTAWLYSSFGTNFVKTMLRVLAERDVVRVVADQVGTPTWAANLSRVLWTLAARPEVHGVMHWTDAGVASWYDFAVAIREEALAFGLIARAAPVMPIRTEDYPTPVKRPSYSVLDKSASWALLGESAPACHWRSALRMMLREMTTDTSTPVGRVSPSHRVASS